MSQPRTFSDVHILCITHDAEGSSDDALRHSPSPRAVQVVSREPLVGNIKRQASATKNPAAMKQSLAWELMMVYLSAASASHRVCNFSFWWRCILKSPGSKGFGNPQLSTITGCCTTDCTLQPVFRRSTG